MTLQNLAEVEAKQIRALNHLQGQLEQEFKSTDKQLQSWDGRLYIWFANKKGEVPEWVTKYTRIFKEFEQNLCALQAQSGMVPLHLIETYNSTHERLKEIASKLNAPQLSKELSVKKFQRESSENIYRIWFQNQPASVRRHQSAWFLHAALMMSAYRQTKDAQLREKISFLVLNYLAKSAPISPREFDIGDELTQRLYGLYQLPYVEGGITYNRESPVFDSYFQKMIEAESAPASGGLFFITDTEDFSDLLPVGFSVIETRSGQLSESNIKEWSFAIYEQVRRHLAEHPENPCDFYLHPGLLVDLTRDLQELILTKGDGRKNQVFANKLEELERTLSAVVEHSVEILRANYPNLCKKRSQFQKWSAWIRANITCICRSKIDGVPITKILPVFCKPEFFKCKPSADSILDTRLEREDHPGILISKKFSRAKSEFEHFLNSTGIRLGSLRGRMRVSEITPLPTLLGEAQNVIAAYGKIKEEANLYVKKDDLINAPCFRRWSELLTHPDEAEKKLLQDKPYIDILGRPTINMLRGVFREITDDQWMALNSDPVLRRILPTQKIASHLECAWKEIDQYSKFTNFMELIHYEILSLLYLFRPFHIEDFSGIYRSKLTCIPPELRPFVRAGLSKSAMNTFAGVYAAVKRTNPHTVVACDEDAHFELFHFIGQDRSIQKVLKDKNIKKVDLLLAEFNHNVSMHPNRPVYQAGDVIGAIEAIFKEKPETQHLTVAVDTTIDFANSERAGNLLKHFASEILEGRLNFVFFRSGKKFDLLGMDDYYGGPSYMINNGDKQWKEFQKLMSQASFTTDFLSLQGFCLLNKYAAQELGNYQRTVFRNTKIILSENVEKLEAELRPFSVRIAKVAKNAEACFIDIKFFDAKRRGTMANRVVELFYSIFVDQGIKVHSRAGYGYFYPNLTMFYNCFDPSNRMVTIRINPGINPEENRIMMQFLRAIPAELRKL